MTSKYATHQPRRWLSLRLARSLPTFLNRRVIKGAALLLFAALICASCVPRQAGAQQPAPLFIALGDSLAYGTGSSLPGERGYPAIAREILASGGRFRTSGLQLLNLSSPGATSAEILRPGGQITTAVEAVRSRGSAAVISINIGGNDILALGPGGSCLVDPFGADCRRQFLEMLEALKGRLEQSLRTLRQAAPEAEIVALTLYNPYSGIGGPLEVGGNLVIEQMNEALKSVAAAPELRVKVADVFPFFAGRARQWISADDFHPNDKGYLMMAEALVAAVEGRTPAIPSALASEPPDPTVTATATGTSDGGDNGGIPLLLIAIPLAAAAATVIGGAYFLARGR